jgi:hypothetical protein
MWRWNTAAKYNRYVITDPTRFQDHRHRRLGHPSALKISPDLQRFRSPPPNLGLYVSPHV